MAKYTTFSKAAKELGFKRRQLKKSFPWLTTVIILIILVRIVSPSFYFKKLDIQRGELALRDIYLPFDVEVTDTEETERLKEKVESFYTRFYNYDSDTVDRVSKKSKDILASLSGITYEDEAVHGENIINAGNMLKQKFGLDMSQDEVEKLFRLSGNVEFKNLLFSTINHLLVERGIIKGLDFFKTFDGMRVVKINSLKLNPPLKITADVLIDQDSQLPSYLDNYLRGIIAGKDKEAVKGIISKIILNAVEPNVIFDWTNSSADKEKKLQNIKPVKKVFHKGEKLISAGQSVSNLQYDAISAINSKLSYLKAFILLGMITFILLAFLIIGFYLKKFKADFVFTSTNIVVAGLPILLSLFFGRVLFLYFKDAHLEIAGYLFPAGVIGMLGVILLEARVAFLLVIWGSILFGMTLEFSFAFRYVLYSLIGGFVSIGFLYTIKERKDIIMAGMKLALVNALTIIIINLLEDPFNLRPEYAVWGIVNGLICICISIPAVPFFENFFGIVTDIRLLELTGINQPIIREFEEKAPGSYHHTLNVAKLADSAATAIGARYLLVRAGAYYHDIGKMTKPKYFTENQVTPEDKKVHSKISPHMSTLIIKNHIREGMELARKHKIPQIIIDFIPQHHGSGLIKYFYYQACKNFENSDSADPVREEDFRYPGPKPQSIEAAIVMLADSVEATVTSKLSKPFLKEDDIRLVVRDTIRDKFNDGQFDECDLTLKDLHSISESFVKTFLSRFHQRIDYPQAPTKKD